MSANGKSRETGRSPVIDVHTHFVPASVARAAEAGETWHGVEFGRDDSGRLVTSLGGERMTVPWPTPLETPAERTRSMDARGVDIHMVSLSPTMHWHALPADDGRGFAMDANDDLAELAASHPDRYLGLGFLPLQDASAAVAELERCTGELGMPGVIVATHVAGMDWDDDALFPVLEAAAALGAFVFFHPARGRANPWLPNYHLRNIIGNPLETTVAMASLIFGGVLDRLPGLTACFAHGGGYGCLGIGRHDHGHRVRAEASAQAARLPSDYLGTLYFDSLTHSERALRHLVDLATAERVVLGSDYPADMGEPYPVAFIESCASLSDAEKRLILGANLRHILEPAPSDAGEPETPAKS